MTDSRIDPHEESGSRLDGLEERLRELEHAAAHGRFKGRRIVPSEAGQHFRAAAREQLLGVRALVDHWIGRLEEHESQETGGRHEEIRIE